MKSQPADGRNVRVTRSGTYSNNTEANSNENSLLEPVPSAPKKIQKGKSKSGNRGNGNKGNLKGRGRFFKMAYTNNKKGRILSESGNNELSKEELSYLTDEEKLLLSSWGLPNKVLAKYRSKGISSLFQWQLDCLANDRVLEGCNLLYSAPTSAGKTLVAEILMIKRVLELGKKAMMILPFVSVAREKMYSLQELFGDAGVRVEGFMGSYNPPGGFQQIDIAICTIEKANSLINRMLEEGTLSQLGTIVVDELHLISDPHRGYLLELLLTKIRFMTSQSLPLKITDSSGDTENNSSNTNQKLNIQVVGMSATIPNLNVLAKWLDAELVISDYRPVPLVERVKMGDTLYDPGLLPIRPVSVESIPMTIPNDPDDMIYLSLETVLGGHSILIFCPTKAMCENLAVQMSREFYSIGNLHSVTSPPEVSAKLREQLNGTRLAEVLQQLKQCPAGQDKSLERAVQFGVAFHHAGLTFDERDILESAFKRGILRVMIATSTLSAGVNLPARRVIIKTPDFGNNLDILTYRQMCGRAGRKGVDTEGESVLVCNLLSQRKAIDLIQSTLPPVKSALVGSLCAPIKRALLEVIASGVASTPAQVNAYAQCTFLSHTIELERQAVVQDPNSSMTTTAADEKELSITDCLKFLEDNDFIRLKVYESPGKAAEYMPTQLGSACLASSLSPDEGILVFKELERARRCFVLENELHIIYQVTPIYIADQWGSGLDWNQYLKLWEKLPTDQQRVGELIGVSQFFLQKAWTGTVSSKNPKHAEILNVHQRFYTALALSDLVNEMPISDVCEKYSVNKGIVQNLQQASSTFAGMVTTFCSRLGWANLELLLSQFQERLQFGVQRELIDLVRLSLLNGQQARVLYDAGIKSIADLAVSEPAQIEQILHKAGPFSSSVHGSEPTKSIWVLGKSETGLSEKEAAALIVKEARQFLQIELGLPENVRFTKKLLEEGKVIEESVRVLRSQLEKVERQSQQLDALGGSESEDQSDNENHDLSNSNKTNGNRSVQPVQEGTANGDSASLHSSADDLFKDSFPAMEEDSSRLAYSKELQKSSHFEISLNEQLLIAEIMSESVSMNMSSAEYNNSSIITNGMNGNPAKELPAQTDSPLVMAGNVLKASTPMGPDGGGTGHEDEDFDFEKEFLLNKFESSDEVSGLKREEAESPKDVLMDSMTSFMEVSLVISDDGKGTEDVYKLSESMLTAAAAMAQESDGSFSAEKPLTQSIFEESGCSSSSDDVLGTSPETQVSHSSQLRARANTSKLSCLSSSRPNHKPLLFLGRVLDVKVIERPELIPAQFFEGDGPIGLGLRLVSPKRSSSMSKIGIGSRILGRSPISARTVGKPIEDDKDRHAIALYTSASDTIWVLEWRAETSSRSHFSALSHGQFQVRELFKRIKSSGKPLALLNAKENLKKLLKSCRLYLDLPNLPSDSQVWDPKIGDWLLNFDDEHFITLDSLLETHLENEARKVRNSGWAREILEAFWAPRLMAVLKDKLAMAQLWKHFTEIEMPSIRPLMLMEMNGFGLNSAELERMKKVLDFKMALLELRAYQLAGRQFSLSSPKDIRQILFREIGLTQPPKTKGTGRDVLLKIDHELPKVIMEWRKVTNALSQVVIPFQQVRNLRTGRVHGTYSHFTLTGRVTMSEPSLQCIPRDFDLQLSYTGVQIEEIRHNCRVKFGNKLISLFFKLENGVNSNEGMDSSSISMRNAFVPSSTEFVLLAADYCQLELRVLAHLSEDHNLGRVLNRPGDVFASIAAQWKNIHESRVTPGIRQEVKAIIYGIIYGMGPKTLSEQMEVGEMEALAYITQFMRSYPGVRSFIDKTIKFCREHGYVETISGRRRYLEHINSRSLNQRAKAERQAVNSRIQGSASDLVKAAMSRIQSRLFLLYPASSSHPTTTATVSDGVIVFPILNLHDELVYEVRQSHLARVAQEIKDQMESCLRLRVPIPVVVKTGTTWSQLTPYSFNGTGRGDFIYNKLTL